MKSAVKWAVVAGGFLAVGVGAVVTYRKREPEPPLTEMCIHFAKLTMEPMTTFVSERDLPSGMRAKMEKACVERWKRNWELAKEQGTTEAMRARVRCVNAAASLAELMACGG